MFWGIESRQIHSTILFFRSIGKVKEAEAIEAQMRAKAAAGGGFAPAAAPQPAAFPAQQPFPAASGYYPGY